LLPHDLPVLPLGRKRVEEERRRKTKSEKRRGRARGKNLLANEAQTEHHGVTITLHTQERDGHRTEFVKLHSIELRKVGEGGAEMTDNRGKRKSILH
jgi:hypothetical protein